MRAACISLLSIFAAAQAPRTFLWNSADLVTTRELALSGDPSLLPAVKRAAQHADAWLIEGPWSVLNKTRRGPSFDIRDYVSLNKYWWPCNALPPNCVSDDPCTNGLPYVSCDGQTNPEMHLYDHDALLNVTTSVTQLGVAYYFTGKEQYAVHASRILDTWFINPQTAMYPNMNFGHFIPGVRNGDREVIIDSHFFPEMLDAVALLSGSSAWSPSLQRSLEGWFGNFTVWLLTSDFGREESQATNNHGVWYDVQTSACALHSGNFGAARTIAVAAGRERILSQIAPNGELPAELARTKSWSYTEFCTAAFASLATLALHSQVNLWEYVSSSGSSIKATYEWQVPYISGAKTWAWPQIVPFLPTDNCIETDVDQCLSTYRENLRRAGNYFNSTRYEQLVRFVTGSEEKYQSDVINLVMPRKAF